MKDQDQDQFSKKLIQDLPITAEEAHIVQEEDEDKFTAGENEKSSKLDHLYTAFWSLLESSIASIKDKEGKGQMFTHGSGFKSFMSMDDVKAEETNYVKNANFDNLSESTKNLIKAVIDINSQLNRAEDIMSENLSFMYLHFAEKGYSCIVSLNENIESYRKNVMDKVNSLQRDVLRDTIGNEFSIFTTKALQSLQMWYEVYKEIQSLEKVTQDPLLKSFLKMKTKNETHTFELLKETILDVRTQIKFIINGLKNIKYFAPKPVNLKNNKLLLRIQKHNILKQKQEEIKRGYLNPVELANKLRLLSTSESEINDTIEKIDEQVENEEDTTVDTNHLQMLLKILLENIENLADQSQKLEIEVTKVKGSLTNQLFKDYSREITLDAAAAKECIRQSRKLQRQEKNNTLNNHETYLIDFKQAEKTIVNELKQLMILNRHESLNIENCLKNVIEASNNHKQERDTKILNKHLHVLRKYIRNIEELIVV